MVEHLDLLLELGRQRLQNVLLVVQLPLSVLDPVEVSHLERGGIHPSAERAGPKFAFYKGDILPLLLLVGGGC